MIETILIAFVATLIWLVYEFKVKSVGADIRTQLPEELRSCKIFSKERVYRHNGDISLVGKPDLVLKDSDGQLIVCETKTRSRLKIYESDILQLSAYKLTLEASTSKPVSGFGWVRLVTTEGNAFRKVSLLDSAEVQAATELHAKIASGKYQGVKCGKTYICNTCAYKKRCDSMAD